ncbi:MAG: hypothetical protein MSG78_04935 [Clostridiales bacterium]|nr:hypothetical protein [Clostridiales bacterium]
MDNHEKKTKYNLKYAKEKLKRIPLDVQKEKYEEIKTHAEKQDESVNGFIKRAIDETIEHDNKKLASATSMESGG